MTELIASFESTILTIKKNRCVWCRSDRGWYHSYNKEMVDNRIKQLRGIIEDLEERYA